RKAEDRAYNKHEDIDLCTCLLLTLSSLFFFSTPKYKYILTRDFYVEEVLYLEKSAAAADQICFFEIA
ncbi:hypothetical protein ACLOJK_033300, partial [Asimina triloba]